MTLLFFDGFDHYNTETEMVNKWGDKYEVGTIYTTFSTSYGRRGTNGARFDYYTGSNHLIRYWTTNLDSDSTGICGIAWKAQDPGNAYSSAYGAEGMSLSDGASAQIGWYLEPNGILRVRRGGHSSTVLGTSSIQLSPDVWYYIELKATIHDTSGSFELRVNGVTVSSDNNIDTQNTANSTVDTLMLHCRPGGGNFVYIDDVYFANSQGSIANDFLGDVKIESLFPTGAGSNTNWTPSTGNNWECVDEVAPDTGDYVYTTTSGLYDTYAFGNLTSASGAILGVNQLLYTAKGDAGVKFIRPACRINSTNYEGNILHSLSDTYVYAKYFTELNPDTSSQWTISDINNAEFGAKSEA